MREDILVLQEKIKDLDSMIEIEDTDKNNKSVDDFIIALRKIGRITKQEDADLFKSNILKVYPTVKNKFSKQQAGEFLDAINEIGQVKLATSIAEDDYKIFKNAGYQTQIAILKNSLHKEFASGTENNVLKNFFSQYYSTNDLMDFAHYALEGKTKRLVKDFTQDPEISMKYKNLIVQAEKDYKNGKPFSPKDKLAIAGIVTVGAPGIIVGGTGLAIAGLIGLLKKGVNKGAYYLATPTRELMQKCEKLTLFASTKSKRTLAKVGQVVAAIPTEFIQDVGTLVGGIIKISEYAVKVSTSIAALPFIGAGKLIMDKAKISNDKKYESEIIKIKTRVAELLGLPMDKKFLDEMFVSVSGDEFGITVSGLYNHYSRTFKLDFADDYGVGKNVKVWSKEEGQINLVKRNKDDITSDFARCITEVSNIVTHQTPTNEIEPVKPFYLLD